MARNITMRIAETLCTKEGLPIASAVVQQLIDKALAEKVHDKAKLGLLFGLQGQIDNAIEKAEDDEPEAEPAEKKAKEKG